jgi:hypothetical protein
MKQKPIVAVNSRENSRVAEKKDKQGRIARVAKKNV